MYFPLFFLFSQWEILKQNAFSLLFEEFYLRWERPNNELESSALQVCEIIPALLEGTEFQLKIFFNILCFYLTWSFIPGRRQKGKDALFWKWMQQLSVHSCFQHVWFLCKWIKDQSWSSLYDRGSQRMIFTTLIRDVKYLLLKKGFHGRVSTKIKGHPCCPEIARDQDV